MRTSFTAVFALGSFIASTVAIPATQLIQRQAGLCSSGLSSPLCCDVDILGVADLNCEQPPTTPTGLDDFKNICASIGKIDMCCVIPILEQGLLCTDASAD